MRAITVREKRLLWCEAADPRPKRGEVILKVHAAGVNRADLLQARGLYPPPRGASDILGLEAAGEVIDLGHGVSPAWLGRRCCALLAGGGYAQMVAVPQQMLLELPAAMSYVQAAAVPEAWFTAYLNLIMEGRLRAGQLVVVRAAAGGVGTAAVQLAARQGATVCAVAGTAEKLSLCRALGATLTCNYRSETLSSALGGKAADLILESVGGAVFSESVAALSRGGRLVLIGLLGGASSELSLSEVLRKNLIIIGSTLRDRSLRAKIALRNRFARDVWPLFAAGELRSIIHAEMSIERAEEAHSVLLQNRNLGKVVLAVPC